SYIIFDAFAVDASVGVGAGTYEDTNSAVGFSGTWTSWSDPGNSGGSARYSNDTSAAASLTFTGSSLTLVYVTQWNTGIATVTIDGTVVDQLDTYAATRLFQQRKTYNTAAGTHTVSVSVSGTKNAAAGGSYIIFDAFAVDASVGVGAGTYEDTNSAVGFSGTWTSWSDPGNSGGSARYSNDTSAAASLTFTGSSLTLVYVTQWNTGIATVTI